LSGDLHEIGRRFLVQTLKITQPDGFEFFHRKEDLTGDMHALGNKRRNGWISGYESRFLGSGHFAASILII